jgi:iron-sulfur cluster assembly accessory protein
MDGVHTTVEITAAAEQKILALLQEEPRGSALRVGVEGGGCSGFKYNFSVAPKPEVGDLLLEQNGARIVVDETSLPFLAGSRVDFVDDLMGQCFRVENPNAASSCGCGVSFSL